MTLVCLSLCKSVEDLSQGAHTASKEKENMIEAIPESLKSMFIELWSINHFMLRSVS